MRVSRLFCILPSCLSLCISHTNVVVHNKRFTTLQQKAKREEERQKSEPNEKRVKDVLTVFYAFVYIVYAIYKYRLYRKPFIQCFR